MVTWPSWLIVPLPHSGLSFQTEKNKSVMVCAMIEIFRKCILTKRNKGQEWILTQSLMWAQVSQLTFNIFVKVDYYPLLALACTCYLIHIVIVYCIWSYIVIWIIWLNLNLNLKFISFYYMTLWLPMFNDMKCCVMVWSNVPYNKLSFC